ncbi:MAG: response regulator, partial [Candidatus Binatia bacterium]
PEAGSSLPGQAQNEVVPAVVGHGAPVTRILVVEDGAESSPVLAALFRRHGIEVLHAQTGKEAVQLCERQPPDLLVLDLRLPDSDSFTVVAWLRRRAHLRQLPVVVYTRKILDSFERERLRLGQTLFLTKDHMTPEEFEQRVVNLLDQIVPHKGKDGHDARQACFGH